MVEQLNEIALIVGIVSSISAWPIFKSIRTFLLNRQNKRANQITQSVLEANKKLTEAYQIEHDNVVNQINSIEKALIASMHDRIYQEGNKLLSQGYATIDQMDNFLHMYNEYHGLGGNGTGEAVKNHVVELPIRDGSTNYVKEANEMHRIREEEDDL